MNHTAVMPFPFFAAGQAKAGRGFAKDRVLLALDGQRLTPALKKAALRCSVQLTSRLDILLVNPPGAPTFVLGGLLLRLEHSGVDYRLTSTEGDLGEEVARYLQRFRGIGLIIVDCLPKLAQNPGLNQSEWHRKGRRFICLTEPVPPMEGGE